MPQPTHDDEVRYATAVIGQAVEEALAARGMSGQPLSEGQVDAIATGYAERLLHGVDDIRREHGNAWWRRKMGYR